MPGGRHACKVRKSFCFFFFRKRRFLLALQLRQDRPVERCLHRRDGAGGVAASHPAFAQFVAGAVAVGAMAIGALAIKRLKIKSARIQRLEIDELVVRKITRPPEA